MDCICIKNLEVYTKHGAFDEENRIGQKYAIDVELFLSTRTAGVCDDLSKSVDYGRVCHFISAFIKGHTYKIIETAAERLAEDILIEFPAISKLILTVKKPWAPVGLPIEEVSVRIERGWHRVFLSLGSNMGDRLAYVNKAISYLRENDRIRIINESKFYETEPYGNVNQDKFINSSIELMTLHTPTELLTFCKNLERMSGRVETEHWGPRPLDIDIIFYDDKTVDLPNLTIPHADMCNRKFVLEPLNEIAPYFRHPVNMKTVSELYLELENKNDN